MLLSWCERHMQVFSNFYENVDKSILWSISHRGGNERGAMATNPKMMPRHHIGSGSSRRYLCKGSKGADVRNMLEMVGWSRIPDVPWVGSKETNDNLDTVQTRASQTSHAYSLRAASRWLYLLKRALSERIKFVEWSRRSRDGGSGSSRSHIL